MRVKVHRAAVALCFIAAAAALCRGAFLLHPVVGWFTSSFVCTVAAGWLLGKAPKSPSGRLSRPTVHLKAETGEAERGLQEVQSRLSSLSSRHGGTGTIQA